jgi:hypothetical protein
MSSSYGIVPYVVQLDPLRAFAGAAAPAIVERLTTRFKREIETNALVFKRQIDAGAPTLDRALTEICNGQFAGKSHGSQYAYAVELLCAQYGEKQANQLVYPIDDQWVIRMVDPIFQQLGIASSLTMKRLIHGAWPIEVPTSEHLPYGGFLDVDEVYHAVNAMRGVQMPPFDRDVMNVIGSVRGWLETAAARRAGLVCFYY